MLPLLLAETAASNSERVLIWTLIGTMVTTIGKMIYDQVTRIQDRRAAIEAREQDRLDAESKARILLQEGEAREKRLSAKIEENTEVSKAAFREANGVNAKLEKHSADVKLATEAIAEATKVVAAAKVERAEDAGK